MTLKIPKLWVVKIKISFHSLACKFCRFSFTEKSKYTKTQYTKDFDGSLRLFRRYYLSVIFPLTASFHEFDRCRVNAETFSGRLRSITKHVTLIIESWAHQLTTNQPVYSPMCALHLEHRTSVLAKPTLQSIELFFGLDKIWSTTFNGSFGRNGKWGKRKIFYTWACY